MYNYLKNEENNFAKNLVDFFLISHWFNIDRVQGDGCSCINGKSGFLLLGSQTEVSFTQDALLALFLFSAVSQDCRLSDWQEGEDGKKLMYQERPSFFIIFKEEFLSTWF